MGDSILFDLTRAQPEMHLPPDLHPSLRIVRDAMMSFDGGFDYLEARIRENRVGFCVPDLGIPSVRLAWIAGLYEGEGTIAAVRNHRTDGCGSVNLTASIKMTDLDILERAQRDACVGRIYGPYRHPDATWKFGYSWNIARPGDVFALMRDMWPWLGYRRRIQTMEKIGGYAGWRDLRLTHGRRRRDG